MGRLLASLLVVGALCVAHAAAPICHSTCLACVGPAADECTSCAAGSYLSGNPGSCAPCAAVSGCIVPPTCTDGGDSHCDACGFGRYRVPGPPDACPPCEAIAGCTDPISCTGPTDSQCGGCAAAPTTTTTLPGAGLAHFNCYKERDLRNPMFVPQRDVSVVDQFGTSEVDLRRPYLLCAPASQEGSAVADASTHLCCYRTAARPLDGAVQAETEDDFGTLQVEVRRSNLLCAPCTKALQP